MSLVQLLERAGFLLTLQVIAPAGLPESAFRLVLVGMSGTTREGSRSEYPLSGHPREDGLPGHVTHVSYDFDALPEGEDVRAVELDLLGTAVSVDFTGPCF